MSNERTERLVNLVLCLLSSRRFQTATKIARTVPGYEHDPEDKRAHEAFQRKFERDKAELRRIGIPLQSGTDAFADAEPGYRIARGDFELPQIEFTDSEAAAVAAAARLWRQPELQSGSAGALRKLRAAGIDVDTHAATGPVKTLPGAEAALSAAGGRRLPPRGRLRLPGHPRRDRPEAPPPTLGLRGLEGPLVRRRTRSRPRRAAGLQALAHHRQGPPDRPRRRLHHPRGRRRPRLRLRGRAPPAQHPRPPAGPPRAAWGVRRRADQIGPRRADGDELCFSYTETTDTARWLASFGPDVLVLEPPELVKETIACLQHLAEEDDR
ncbi:hypothetical protein GCM10029992_43830 [Glycomyces albus]